MLKLTMTIGAILTAATTARAGWDDLPTAPQGRVIDRTGEKLWAPPNLWSPRDPREPLPNPNNWVHPSTTHYPTFGAGGVLKPERRRGQ